MQQRTSGKAIAALVLGICSLCVPYVGIVTSIIAIVFGILGMKEVDRNPQTVKGKGMAIAGLVMGILALLLYIIVIAFFGALLASFGECIQDPEAPGCEDFQDPEAQAIWSSPAAVVGPSWSAWPAFAGLALPVRAWAS